MILTVVNLGKRYEADWVIRNLNLKLTGPGIYAIKGPNGSGKSTLLKLLSGLIRPSKGEISFSIKNTQIEESELFQHISITAPYMELIEELKLDEFLRFHCKFKEITVRNFKERTLLLKQGEKYIKDFSSGMKQRVKLGLSFYSNTEFIFIDEGITNLDEQGVNWYHEEISSIKDKIVILFSNQEAEYKMANQVLDLMELQSNPD